VLLIFSLFWEYIQPILGDRVKNIEQGIYYLNQSLQECTRSKDPEYWAGIQYNLGLAYSERILGEKSRSHDPSKVKGANSFPSFNALIQLTLSVLVPDLIA
jgi:hypothetical protein